jgi:hypothetical protein
MATNTEQIIEKKTLFIGIVNHLSYDSSKNNMILHYNHVKELLDMLNSDVSKDNTAILETKKTKFQSINSNVLLLYNAIINNTYNLMFKFLCSSECKNGVFLVNKKITDMVQKFIKKISIMPLNYTGKKIIFEFSDHSLASLCNNWNVKIMDIECPLIISNKTNHGKYEMTSTKQILLKSAHPILNKIGNLSATEEIKITFTNMIDTKIYTVKNDEVNILSYGKPLNKSKFICNLSNNINNTDGINNTNIMNVLNDINTNSMNDLNTNSMNDLNDINDLNYIININDINDMNDNNNNINDMNDNNNNMNDLNDDLNDDFDDDLINDLNDDINDNLKDVSESLIEPIHSELEFNNIVFVFSSTHWCNLTEVESDINIDKLKEYTCDLYGDKELEYLNNQIDLFKDDPLEFKRSISESVRKISSGTV